MKLREVTEADADFIVRWRNRPDARKLFFADEVVTPDTHKMFMKNRRPHDLVWIIEDVCGQPVGMCSLTVSINTYEAEFGRLYIDPARRGEGFAGRAVKAALEYAFQDLGLYRVWIEAFETNEAVLSLYRKLGFTQVEEAGRIVRGQKTVYYEITYETWRSRHVDSSTQTVTDGS